MAYVPTTDFLALLRQTMSGVYFARMPGLDFVMSAMARSGMFRLWIAQDAPTTNQATTVWLRPSEPSWTAEGTVFLWDATTAAYKPATPELWDALVSAGSIFYTVPSVAAMKAMAPPPANSVVRFFGYYAPEDGGGGFARVVTAGPWIADDGLVFASGTPNVWFIRDTSGAYGMPSKWFGTKGDGVTIDRVALNNAISAAITRGTFVSLEAGTFIVDTPNSKVILGARRYYAFSYRSFIRMVGTLGKSIIKLADNQSSVAAPRDTNIFVSDSGVVDTLFDGITFDMNAANNPINSGGIVPYPNQFCCGVINVTGNAAYTTRLEVTRCTFMNNAGTNVIVTGQSANNFVGPLGTNNSIHNNVFFNNGLNIDDHSTLYMWDENSRVYNNVMTQDLTTLTTVNRNWVGAELHGANAVFHDNIVEGYYRLCWIASNFTRDADAIKVVFNSCKVWGSGPSYFRQTLPSFTEIPNSVIAFNTITLLPNTPIGVKAGISCVTDYRITNAQWRNNVITATGTGYDSVAFNLTISTPGQVTRGIYITGNQVKNTNSGLYARLNSNTGILDEIHDWDNSYYDLGKTDTTALSVGSRYQADDASVFFGKVSSLRNRYIANGGVDYDTAQLFSGAFDQCGVDNNVYSGQVNFTGPYSIDQATATITRSYGVQLRTYNKVPTSGTWLAGEVVYNYNVTQAKNIQTWQYSSAAGHFFANGNGFGNAGSRPALGAGINDVNADDAGYTYYNTTSAKNETWSGAAWL